MKKTRPALVISPSQYNKKTGLALFMPITSQIKGYPFEVLIEIDNVSGVVICDQIRSLDWKARRARFAGQASTEILEDVLEKIKVLL